MSIVKSIDSGVAYSTTTGAAYIDLSAAKVKKFSQVKPYEDSEQVPWAMWGEDNLLPQTMIQDIESVGFLNAIIDGKARFAACQGIVPAKVGLDEKLQTVIKGAVEDPEIDSFLRQNNHFLQTYALMKDFAAFSWGVVRIMLSNDRSKVVSFQRDDLTEVRIGKKEKKTGKIKSIYISAQWDKVGASADDERLIEVPLLDPNNPYIDLLGRNSGQEFAMIIRNPGWGKHYYPIPMWMTSYKWMKIAQGVPEMKAALFENNMRIKYQVTIFEKYWETAYGEEWNNYTQEEQRKKKNDTYDSIDKFLVGSKNAFKSIFVDGKWSIDGKEMKYVQIEPIDDTTKQGELLPDSAAANSEMAFCMLFNPAIIGASMPSGPYTNSQGGSNVRESVLMQVIIHEFERQMIRVIMDVIKYYNKWDVKHPGLEFLIPATILTTLDTGAGTKPVVTGEQAPANEKKEVKDAA